MLHRRGLSDDCKGLKESLNDIEETTGTIYLNFGMKSGLELKMLEKEMNHGLLRVNQNYDFAKINYDLPEGIYLMDLHVSDFDSDTLVIRLENLASIKIPNIKNIFGCEDLKFYNLSGVEVLKLSDDDIARNSILTIKCRIK